MFYLYLQNIAHLALIDLVLRTVVEMVQNGLLRLTELIIGVGIY